MSGYIPAFIFDPFFRQARRLSRVSEDVPQAFAAPSEDRDPSPVAGRSVVNAHPESTSSSSKNDPITAMDKSGSNSTNTMQMLAPSDRPARNSTNLSVDRHPGAIEDVRSNSIQDASTEVQTAPTTSNPVPFYEDAISHVGPPAIANSSSIDHTARAQSRGHERTMHDRAYDGCSALPADDGMRILRRRIQHIRDSGITHAEKAREIHLLMTETYHATRSERTSLLKDRSHNVPSDITIEAGRVDRSPEDNSNDLEIRNPTSDFSHMRPRDLEPTFAPSQRSSSISDSGSPSYDPDEIEDSERNGPSTRILGCRHYKRNVKLQCFDCRRWYTCRFCHDEVEDHKLNRRATQNMLCMICATPQPAGEWCCNCGELAASYYCSVCKLWNNDPEKSIYHCSDCGICRRGEGLGKDFFHCKTCAVCINISIENSHRCIERSTQCDCPICGEYMFTSPERVVFMKCGHSIHHKCFTEYARRSYRCPICGKSVTNMETQFRNLDRTIRAQPMPQEFADTRAAVYCNDCSARTVVAFHWLGLKCGVCDSYNTNQLQLIGFESANPPITTAVATTEDLVGNAQVSVEEPEPASILPEISRDSRTTPWPISSRRPHTSASHQHDTATSTHLSTSLRSVRSVSPVVGNYFGLHRDTVTIGGISPERERNGERGLDLWGHLSPSRLLRGMTADPNELIESDDDFEDESVSAENNRTSVTAGLEDDDEDEEDEISLFGHR